MDELRRDYLAAKVNNMLSAEKLSIDDAETVLKYCMKAVLKTVKVEKKKFRNR